MKAPTQAQVKVLLYEISHVRSAAFNVRNRPVNDVQKNLDILDEKINVLGLGIEGLFGDPWEKERRRHSLGSL